MVCSNWQSAGRRHLWMPYTQMKTAPPPLPVARTEGCEIILADGRRLLDAISSWWTVAHGYNHPVIVSRMKEQLERMPHVMLGGLLHEPASSLAARLAELLPGELNRVFFADSGSVAIEVALKIAVQFWFNQQQPGKSRFVSFENSYHGDTAGAMSVCDPEDSMHAHFKGFLLEQFPHPIPTSASEWATFRDFLANHVSCLAGVIIEPLVQAAGGMRFHSAGQLQQLRGIVSEFNLLLIVDEIATGFGRTGTMFAIEQAGVEPDLICLGKGLTGGSIGLAATVASDQIFEAFYQDEHSAALMHGPTFMGNPLACSAALASLDLFASEPRLEQARRLEQLFSERLQLLSSHPEVVDVRCLGGIAAIQFQRSVNKYAVMEMALMQNVWLRPLRDVIYLMPPLVVSEAQALRLCDVVSGVVNSPTSAWLID